jgi:capsular polysaccharide biosynthesis protein
MGCASMRVPIDRWLRSEPPPSMSFGNGEVSILDVAVARQLIEARGDVALPIQSVVGGAFADPEARAAFEANPGSVEVNDFELRDVTLVTARLLLFQHGERIVETRYLVGDGDYWRQPPAPRETRVTGGDKAVVLGVNLAFRNYYHWMMQCLPAIAASVETVGAADCVLALPKLAGWQEESLAALGFAGLPRVQLDFDCHYRFERVHYCTWLNGSTAFSLSPRSLRVMRRLAARIEPVESAPERLYVARLDSRNRVMRNEVEVRRLLESHGFTTLVPGYYSLRDQIGLFKSARVVIGAHGAGLTNVGFCQDGTTVLELVQSNYPNVCMARIAQGRGLRYHAECFECAVNPDVHGQDWSIDMNQFETKLRTLLDSLDG